MNLREQMPHTYAFIEELRAAFGVKQINAQIKLGMEGAQTFHAIENSIEVGTKIREPVKFVVGDTLLIRENVGEVMAMVSRK